MSCRRGRWSPWMPLHEGLAAWRRSRRGLDVLTLGRPKTGCQGCAACRCVQPCPRQGPGDPGADITSSQEPEEDHEDGK